MAQVNNKNLQATPLDKSDKLSLKKLIELRFLKGCTLGEISKISGVPQTTLHEWYKPIKKLIKNPDQLDIYSRNKAAFLKSVEFELLGDLLNADKRKRASLNNIAYAFQQVHVARRLEEGLSTGNLAVNVERTLQKAHERASEMRDRIKENRST